MKKGIKGNILAIFVIGAIICIIIGSMIHLTGAELGFGNSGVVSDNIEVQAFEKIKLDIGTSKVIIKKGNEYEVSYKNIQKKFKPEINCKNGVLSVEQKIRKKNFMFRIGKNNKDEIIITIPDDSPLVSVNGEIKMGGIKATDLSFSDIALEINMGGILFDNVNCENVDLEVDMGGLEFVNSEFDSIKADVNMGGIKLNKCNGGSADLKAEMGGVDVSGEYDSITGEAEMGGIELDVNDDCKIDVETEMGGVRVNGTDMGKKYKN